MYGSYRADGMVNSELSQTTQRAGLGDARLQIVDDFDQLFARYCLARQESDGIMKRWRERRGLW